MPAALDVDREAVKTLAIAVGVREAARQMSIPEATVQAWSARFGWFEDKITPKPPHLQPATVATKPSQALNNVLESRKQRTRLNLTKYLVNGSKVAAKSRSPLRDAPNVKALAGVMQAVWPPEQGAAANVMVNVALLGS
jgi:hypothetical protein